MVLKVMLYIKSIFHSVLFLTYKLCCYYKICPRQLECLSANNLSFIIYGSYTVAMSIKFFQLKFDRNQ